MIDLPIEIKNLFFQSSIKKNFRISFPNGEHDDIINERIVAETISLTESLCSRDTIKFGLSEASVLKFDCFNVDNIKGLTIDAQLEIDVSSVELQEEIELTNFHFETIQDETVIEIKPVLFSTIIDRRRVIISPVKFVAYMSNIKVVNSGYDTVYYTEATGWILEVRFDPELDQKFENLSDGNAFIYDESSGSLSKVDRVQNSWRVEGVTNLNYPDSPNYDLYEDVMARSTTLQISTSDDVDFPFYVIPYGRFIVDSCDRHSDITMRSVEAYTDIGKYFSLPSLEISKLFCAKRNEIEYFPNLYGLLSYYGIFREKWNQVSTRTLTEADTIHIKYETQDQIPYILEDNVLLGQSMAGNNVYVCKGANFVGKLIDYVYSLTSNTIAGGYDDTFTISNTFQIDTLGEKEFQDNIFDFGNTTYLLQMGEIFLTELNARIEQDADLFEADKERFMLADTKENKTFLANVILKISQQTYFKLKNENRGRPIVTPSVSLLDELNREFAYGDLPAVFNNSSLSEFHLYPYFKQTPTESEIFTCNVVMPILFGIQVYGSNGFAVCLDGVTIYGMDFVTIIDDAETVISEFDFVYEDEEGEHFVSNKDIIFENYGDFIELPDLHYDAYLYKQFPTATIQKYNITEEKIQEFKDIELTKDKFGYYEVKNFDPKDWISDYMEMKALFCSYSRATGVYGQKMIATDVVDEIRDLTPSMNMYSTRYIESLYSEEPTLPIEAIKYSCMVEEPPEKEGDEPKKKKVDKYYPADGEELYFYDVSNNKLFEDLDEQTALQLATTLYNLIAGLTYVPSDIDCIGIPYIETGDIIKLITKYETITTVVLRRTLDGIYSLRDSLESK